MAYRRTLLQELKTLLHVESILAFSSLVILIINRCRLNRIRKDRYRFRILTGKLHITKFNNRLYKAIENVNDIATNPQPPVRQMVATLTTGCPVLFPDFGKNAADPHPACPAITWQPHGNHLATICVHRLG